MRVLVYESNSKIRDSMMSILIMAGFDVVALKDKNKILSMLGKRPFNIAIIDIVEDDEEIINITKNICSDDRYNTVHTIVHTEEISKELMTNMLEAGAIGFLLKPFNEKDFLSRFNKILEKIKKFKKI